MRETRSAAILAADAVGYSHAAETNEPLALQALSNSRRLIDPLIRAHGGRIFHTGGDSVLAEFARADEAVRCGVSLQRELRAAENAEALFGFRIGISFGEVVTDGDDLLGSTVNLAARLEAIAPAGGICISGPVHDAAGGVGEEWQDLGLRYLKNFSRPARIFRFAPPNASNLPVVAGARKPLVIVLPLARQGSRKDDDYLGEGVTEDVVAGLARFGRLAVLGTASSEAYRDRAVRLPELVAELGVDYVVGGSVRSAGDKVRLSVQLLDARSGLTLWAERYDRPLGDLFATQDEISATIVSTLAGQIEGETAAAAARKRTENMEAYDFLLRGIHQARDLDPKAAGAALKLFEQALALDPEYAAALAWFALMKLRLWAWHPEPAGGEAMFAAAKRALTLDPSDSWCHLVYGQIALYLGRFAEAEQHHVKAYDLNPFDAHVMALRAPVSIYLGKADEGERWARRAMALNPGHPDWYVTNLGLALYMLGRYDEAVAAYALVAAPQVGILAGLAASHAGAGNGTAAAEARGRLLALAPSFSARRFVDSKPFRDRAHRDRLFDDLIKAGLSP